MARGKLTIKKTGRSQENSVITFVPGDAVNDHSFDNSSENVLLVIKNDHTEDQTVTIKRSVVIDDTPLGDVEITVPKDGGVVVAGPFPAKWYSQADTGNALNQAVLVDMPETPTGIGLAAITVGS